MTKHARRWMFLILTAAITSLTGCRLCCDLEDAAFPAYGGAWERTERNSGRVGSVFDPGGAKAAELAARDSADDRSDPIGRIAPGLKPLGDDPKSDPSLERTPPEMKSKEELEQEFQEKLKDFKEGNEELSTTGIIPGPPLPPEIR